EGWNTDGIGFHRHLTQDLKFNLLDKKAVILGAGGASKAVVNQLARHGIKTIVINDINKDKASQLAEKTNKEFPKCNMSFVDSIDKIDIKSADLLINTTPVGMKETDPCLIKEELLHKNLFVYDLIYNPMETKLLRLAKNIGCKTSNGLGMLLYQGTLSFKHFTGLDAPIQIMKQALEEAINKL
ncbi:MAG: shikimate dehydrogenase, partial [Candidatus Omnitrophota bacterium]